jgi:hypothetical protein
LPASLATGPGRPVLLAAGCTAAVLLTNLVDFEVEDGRVGILNANLASSWSHRATAGVLLLGGGLAALRATRVRRRRRCWGVAAAALTLLFVVEVSPAHVDVDRLSYGKLVYLPLLACLVVCVWRLVDDSDGVSVIWVALAALVSSYALHVLAPTVVRVLGWGTDSLAYQVKVGLKEGTELSGWLLLVLALWGAGSESADLDHRLGAGSKLVRWAVGSARGTD